MRYRVGKDRSVVSCVGKNQLRVVVDILLSEGLRGHGRPLVWFCERAT